MYTSHPLKSNHDQSLDILRLITDERKRVISSMNYKKKIVAWPAAITQVKNRLFLKINVNTLFHQKQQPFDEESSCLPSNVVVGDPENRGPNSFLTFTPFPQPTIRLFGLTVFK
jgi:hypothetical protein